MASQSREHPDRGRRVLRPRLALQLVPQGRLRGHGGGERRGSTAGAAGAQRYEVVLLDIKMPGMDGMELQEHIHRIDPQVAVIMITAFASVDTAVRALKQGAFDYVTKPIDPDELSHLVAAALEQRRLREENMQLRETIDEVVAVDKIVGESPPMRKVMELVEHVSKTDATVLIRGESGTGKEVIARAIHANSKRRYFPIVVGQLRRPAGEPAGERALRSREGRLHRRQYRRKGKIEMADGGTLFLDEVGAINAKMQVDLLRVLETKELTRVGGTRPIKVDFRVICATNENLELAVRRGPVPRGLLLSHQCVHHRSAAAAGPPVGHSRAGASLSRPLRQADGQAHHRHQPRSDGPADGLRLAGQRARALQRHRAGDGGGQAAGHPARGSSRCEDRSGTRSSAGESLAEMEKRHIAAVLERTDGNVTRAAEILKVDRVTVYNKIKKYGLRP